MALPNLTPEQRAEALKKAAAARAERAQIKNDLKNRKIKLSDVLKKADKSEVIAKMKVLALLESLPRVGSKTAASVLEEVGIAPSRRIRGLGKHQRDELVRRFG